MPLEYPNMVTIKVERPRRNNKPWMIYDKQGLHTQSVMLKDLPQFILDNIQNRDQDYYKGEWDRKTMSWVLDHRIRYPAPSRRW
jgi:hypothetical protein